MIIIITIIIFNIWNLLQLIQIFPSYWHIELLHIEVKLIVRRQISQSLIVEISELNYAVYIRVPWVKVFAYWILAFGWERIDFDGVENFKPVFTGDFALVLVHCALFDKSDFFVDWGLFAVEALD